MESKEEPDSCGTDFGLFELFRWAPRSPLLSSELRLSESYTSSQKWFDADALAAANAAVETLGEPTVYATGFQTNPPGLNLAPDHLTITVALSRYANFRAVRNLMKREETRRPLLAMAHDRSLIMWMIANSPPSSIGLAVNLVSTDGRFVLIQRSQNVGANRGRWMLGIGETVDPPQYSKISLDSLVRTAARHEADLETDWINYIRIGWIGFDVLSAQLYVVAHLITKLPSKELLSCIRSSSESAEHEIVDSWPLTHNGVATLTQMIRRDADSWVTGSRASLRSLWEFFSHAQP